MNIVQSYRYWPFLASLPLDCESMLLGEDRRMRPRTETADVSRRDSEHSRSRVRRAANSSETVRLEPRDLAFAIDRARFVLDGTRGTDAANGTSEAPERIGTVAGVRETTREAVEAITSPDGDEECPHCGLALGENGPPMCSRCGAPY